MYEVLDARITCGACDLFFFGDANEKFRGESMVLIEIEMSKAVISVDRRVLVFFFLVGSVIFAGCGVVVLVSCFSIANGLAL